jgi:hypothetical protein
MTTSVLALMSSTVEASADIEKYLFFTD